MADIMSFAMIDDSIRRLPFCIGVVGNFRGEPLTPREPPGPHSFVRVTTANLDDVLREMEPRLQLRVDNTLTGEGQLNVELMFQQLGDFDAPWVAARVDPLRRLLESREALRQLLAHVGNNEALAAILHDLSGSPATLIKLRQDYDLPESVTRESSTTDDLLSRYDPPRTNRNEVEVEIAGAMSLASHLNAADQRERAGHLLRGFIDQVDTLIQAGSLEKTLEATIYALDQTLSRQLDRIMHAPDFVRLEASWRGLARLVRATERMGSRIRLLDLSRAMLRQPAALDSISRETELWGGDPVTLVVNDFSIVNPLFDLLYDRNSAKLALAGKAIVISNASPRLLGLSSFNWLGTVRDIRAAVESNDFDDWNRLRASVVAPYAIATLPRVLMRKISQSGPPVERFGHEENLDDVSEGPWGSAAFLLAETLALAFADHPFGGRRVQGPGSQGEFTDLPFRAATPTASATIGPTESVLTATRCRELADLGFTVLSHVADGSRAAFASISTCAADDIDIGRRTTRMPVEHRLVLTRLCHHIVCDLHDTWGRYATLADCEEGLNRRFAAEIARARARADQDILLERATIRLALDAERRVAIDVEARIRGTSMVVDSMTWSDSIRVTLPI